MDRRGRVPPQFHTKEKMSGVCVSALYWKTNHLNPFTPCPVQEFFAKFLETQCLIHSNLAALCVKGVMPWKVGDEHCMQNPFAVLPCGIILLVMTVLEFPHISTYCFLDRYFQIYPMLKLKESS